MKVTIVGAGAVGATSANVIAQRGIAREVVLLDIREGIAEGKAIDMMQTAAILVFDTDIRGVTDDYAATEGSDVVVITSGMPRKPGMTREDLVDTNAMIVKTVISEILKYSPDAIFIMVSNPMDTMTYLALKNFGLPKNRVIGMGGGLDSARFKYYLSCALGCSPSDLTAMVIGGHGDTTMLPLIKHATWNGVPVSRFLSEDKQQEIVSATMTGGATLTKLIGTSAWYAPGAAISKVVESILRDEKRLIPCSVLLDGEYGLRDIAIGVPAIIGKDGWSKVIEIDLDDEDKSSFLKSATAVSSMNSILKFD